MSFFSMDLQTPLDCSLNLFLFCSKMPRTMRLLEIVSLHPARPRLKSDTYYTSNEIHPLYPGVTVSIGHRNTIISHFASGKALLYADANGTLLPGSQQIDMQEDSIYDMASLTKLFTTVLALDQIGKVSSLCAQPLMFPGQPGGQCHSCLLYARVRQAQCQQIEHHHRTVDDSHERL